MKTNREDSQEYAPISADMLISNKDGRRLYRRTTTKGRSKRVFRSNQKFSLLHPYFIRSKDRISIGYVRSEDLRVEQLLDY